MKTVALSELFEVRYGVNLELNRMTPDPGGIPFVGRSERNNGMTGRVKQLPHVMPLPAGTLTVAGGGSVLATFLQLEPYYSGRDLYYLTPRQAMTDAQKLYYAACIRANRYRYSYGRQANRTLKTLKVPRLDELPTWVSAARPGIFDGKDAAATPGTAPALQTATWKAFTLSDLFSLKKGKRLTKADSTPGQVPFVGAVDKNNGIRQFIANATHLHAGGTITVNYNGSVGEAFYQPTPFWASDDVNVLYPRFPMSPEMALFVCALIRLDKYRFNYGRKWHLERMRESVIRLPVNAQGQPDWPYMERYIKALPFSSQVVEPPAQPAAPTPVAAG